VKRWVCPRCRRGKLAPERPRADDARAYCLPCSTKAQDHRLVRLVCPARERARVQTAAQQKLRAKSTRAEVAEHKEVVWTRAGLDVRKVVRRVWCALLPDLRAAEAARLLEAEQRVCNCGVVGPKPRFPAGNHASACPSRERSHPIRLGMPSASIATSRRMQRSGNCEYSGHKLAPVGGDLVLPRDADAALVWAEVVKELAGYGAVEVSGTAGGKDVTREYNRLLSRVAQRLWGVAVPDGEVGHLLKVLRARKSAAPGKG
jgi:hypothetical protein